jgi:hypothetical protein
MVPAGSHKISPVSRYSGYCYLINCYVYGIITLYDHTFQNVPLSIYYDIAVLQPQDCLNNLGLGSSLFARHYLGNHYCFIFLRVLRCFSSPGLLSFRNNVTSLHWVSPFGNLRIEGYLHLPEAYRSLSRPSSPLRAKASAMRPYLLS